MVRSPGGAQDKAGASRLSRERGRGRALPSQRRTVAEPAWLRAWGGEHHLISAVRLYLAGLVRVLDYLPQLRRSPKIAVMTWALTLTCWPSARPRSFIRLLDSACILLPRPEELVPPKCSNAPTAGNTSVSLPQSPLPFR
jgi:hypothetical protein